tara:strand:+ start:1624 stop:2124 length:501 start_codon:yes stop_codon:yes gene_type:complete
VRRPSLNSLRIARKSAARADLARFEDIEGGGQALGGLVASSGQAHQAPPGAHQAPRIGGAHIDAQLLTVGAHGTSSAASIDATRARIGGLTMARRRPAATRRPRGARGDRRGARPAPGPRAALEMAHSIYAIRGPGSLTMGRSPVPPNLTWRRLTGSHISILYRVP